MFKVFFIAAILIGLGRWMGVSRRAQISVLVILFTSVMFFQLTLPDGNALRETTGGSAFNWAIVGGLAVLIWLYRGVLQRFRARHASEQPAVPETAPGTFGTEELNRYARHIALREIGGAGQKKLKSASVLVVGAGGLGSPALQYLGAAGVGVIGVIDDDVVEATNLQRQTIHTDARIGMPKVFSAVEALQAQNPYTTVRPYNRRLEIGTARDLFAEYDLVLDGSDNFETRALVNEACVALGKPLISAAITQWEGQISLFHPGSGGPCYACVFPVAPDRSLTMTCAEAGVLGALPGVIGAMMAVEAIKWITAAGESLTGRLVLYDALYAETRVVSVKRDPGCQVCGSDAA